jgi:hypothetical protein
VRSSCDAEPMRDCVEDGSMHGLGVAGCIDQDTAGRIVGGNSQKTVPEPFVKSAVEAFETVGGRASGRASQAGFHRKIEYHRQIW